MLPLMLFFNFTHKSRRDHRSQTEEAPNINILEQKLKHLLERNQQSVKTADLQKELQQSKSNTVAAYIKLNKKDLKGFPLFQLIFSLIKNREEDTKIIKVLRHYLPSCATSHLYAILHSFKIFLRISEKDGCQKELLRDLNHNRVRTTLLYLQKKLNQTLNQITSTEPAMQTMLIDRAVIYGLVFASFAEFYDNDATEKILRLVSNLSPNLFKYWHAVPQPEFYEAIKGHLPVSIYQPTQQLRD